jgi:hypothetical protein
VHPCFVGAFADWSDPAKLAVDDRCADRSHSFDGPWHVGLLAVKPR